MESRFRKAQSIRPISSEVKIALVVAIIAFAACGAFEPPWRLTYLQNGKGTLTQDEVLLKLGPPHATRKTSAGQEVWLYQYGGTYTQSQPDFVFGGQRVVSGSNCAEYIVVFKENILNDFTRQGC